MEDTWYNCFARLPEFENLRGVSLIFDRHGGELMGSMEEHDLLQGIDSRVTWRQKVFRLLEKNIQDLSIRHFQDYHGDSLRPKK
jgi:hypothetical protein